MNIDSSLRYVVDTDLFAESVDCEKVIGDLMSPPYTLCIEADRRCNLTCRVCISDSSPREAANDSWIADALNTAATLFGPLRVVWSGGEPMIRPKLREQLRLSRLLGNRNVVATNATRLVRGLDLDWVDVSVYGWSEDSFRAHTHGQVRFSTVAANVKRYVQEYPRVSTSFVLGVFPTAELVRMVEFALDSGVQRLKFHRLSHAGRLPDTFSAEAFELQVASMAALLNGRDVCATFSRSSSSDHKRMGYWVVKPPGSLTNAARTVDLKDVAATAATIAEFQSTNRALFTTLIKPA
jgi:molybdenum cofactor biosynthesis enzyme MoaA